MQLSICIFPFFVVCWLTGCIDVNDLSFCWVAVVTSTLNSQVTHLILIYPKINWLFIRCSPLYFSLHLSLAQSFWTTKYKWIASDKNWLHIKWWFSTDFQHIMTPVLGEFLWEVVILSMSNSTPVSTCYINSRNAKVPVIITTFTFPMNIFFCSFSGLKVGCAISSCSFSSMLAVHQTVEMRAGSFWPGFANDFTPFTFVYLLTLYFTLLLLRWKRHCWHAF